MKTKTACFIRRSGRIRSRVDYIIPIEGEHHKYFCILNFLYAIQLIKTSTDRTAVFQHVFLIGIVQIDDVKA